jgi:hypothetical protein
MKLLQINYKFSGSQADFAREFGPVAEAIAAVPGSAGKSGLRTRRNLAAAVGICLTMMLRFAPI